MEIAKRLRKRKATMWRGWDTEGRRVFAATTDREGVAVEPTGGYQYTIAKALTTWDKDKALADWAKD